MKPQPHSIPVVDVDSAFPAMVERPGASRDAAVPGDLGPQVTNVLRDVLGWRPRPGDAQAFENALGASFRLRMVEGHVQADYVPRGYAVQADLGAVTGGQASLYRRAMLARTEALRILDGLTPLRMDADPQDTESYRLLVRNAVERLVDELGAAGGPRVQMVDLYFAGLTGDRRPGNAVTADTVAGQLGTLRERFGLVNGNVNSVEDEGLRTAFWTLVDLVIDLQRSWAAQRLHFGGAAGQGFLGTDLILLSRLMEAAADQVDEVESVLDSVLIEESERRTLLLDADTGLTLDGLLTWLRAFLSDEGRRLAQDAGRDGIVSALAPMAVELVRVFRLRLAERLETYGVSAAGAEDEGGSVPAADPAPVIYLPASGAAPLPAGMYAARTRIAVAGLCRLLTDLAKTAQRIGRWSEPVIISVTIRPIQGREGVHEVVFRGLNFRTSHIPAFVLGHSGSARHGVGTLGADGISHGLADGLADGHANGRVDGTSNGLAGGLSDPGTDGLVLALRGSSTADDESITALFQLDEITRIGLLGVLNDPRALSPAFGGGFTVPAEVLPVAIVDGETGSVIVAPEPLTWPALRSAKHALDEVDHSYTGRWSAVPRDEHLRTSVLGQVPIAASDETEVADIAEDLLAVDPAVIARMLGDPEQSRRLRALFADAGARLSKLPTDTKQQQTGE